MYNLKYYIHHIQRSILDALRNRSELTDDILNLEGMSGHKNRHLHLRQVQE